MASSWSSSDQLAGRSSADTFCIARPRTSRVSSVEVSALASSLNAASCSTVRLSAVRRSVACIPPSTIGGGTWQVNRGFGRRGGRECPLAPARAGLRQPAPPGAAGAARNPLPSTPARLDENVRAPEKPRRGT